MNETYYVATYWPGRPELLETYARRAESFFRQMGALDPVLTRWFEQASSREKALQSQFTPDLETLFRLLEKKKYKRSVGDVAFAAWNGEGVDNSVASFRCGSRTPEIIVDLCLLDLPSEGPAMERLLHASVLVEILRAMVLAWEPDTGIATSRSHRSIISESAKVGTFVGWITYFSKARGPIPPLPAPVRVEPVEDKGTLIILTPERCTASNPEHVALAAQVQDILGEAGLLKPVTERPPPQL